jgi:5-(carboxyamino)imidazole ribonucleotide synthase
MTDVWVLGNGQLGAMLQQAAMPLAIRVNTVDIEAPLEQPLGDDAIVTAEREHWAPTPATQHLFDHPGFVSRRAFAELPDRKTQKQWLDRLELANAKWRDLDAEITGENLHRDLGDRVLLKRRTGGYDGKGQLWLRKSDTAIPDDWRGHAIAEEAVGFEDEVSIIGVRNQDGRCEFYPLTLNLHSNGILMASIAPVPRLQLLQAQAEAMLDKLMQALDYVGVMAMECFLVGDRLLVNEVAPRVHNSGHWTQAGSSISQFENHLRAISGLPLAKPLVKNTSVMLNLIGMERDNHWLGVDGAELYWYGKQVLPGRKLGHINLSPAERPTLLASLEQLQPLLPNDYAATIEWVLEKLAPL